ncbi:MAG: CapA family protein [Lachnospiraceae bacterium]|nr:CapA family protein [Lachnospiraceae bacterium]
MKRKISFLLSGIALVLMAVVTGLATAYLFRYNRTLERQSAKTGQTVEKIENQRENLAEENAPDESLEETEQLCSLLTGQEERIDDGFARWLVNQYPEVCSRIAEKMQLGDYEPAQWYYETGNSLFVLRDEANGILDSEVMMGQNLIYRKECEKEDYISLSFAGDISATDDYGPGQNYTREGIDGAFSKDVQQMMKSADIFMLNNEFCYSNRGTPVPKGYNFRAAPSRVERLEEMGVDIVSIANNHAYDYGEEAFVDTMDTLNDAGIPYVGGGMDLEDAKNHIVYFIANGMKIGYIAATQVERDEPVFTKEATQSSPGVVRCYEPDVVVEMIRQAKENCDFVVVYPHWGTELVTTVQEDQQALAYAFIDAGADVIVGGHPHCLQGAEYYKGVPIFYSLSNFSFSSKTVNSTILNLRVTIDGIANAQYIPCMETGGRTHRCENQDNDYVRIIKLLNDVSVNVYIDEEGTVSEITG